MTRTFRREIQRALLWEPKNQLSLLKLHGFHALWRHVPVNFISQKEIVKGPKPHISQNSRIGIRFVLLCFRSTLITESLLLSFPAGTKMLQFPAFPLLIGTVQVSRVQRLHAPRPGLSQLATPFYSTQA